MPRAPRRTFTALPGGEGGSSTNPETAARNKRRRALSPLSAEYERAQANRGNRVSSKLKKLRKTDGYRNAAGDDAREAMEKEIRDREEEVYQADRREILQMYNARTVVAATIAAGTVMSVSALRGGESSASGVSGEGDSDIEYDLAEEGELMSDGFVDRELYDFDAVYDILVDEGEDGGEEEEEEEDEEDEDEDEDDVDCKAEDEEDEDIGVDETLTECVPTGLKQLRQYYERRHTESLIALIQFSLASEERKVRRLAGRRAADRGRDK